jgi:hypothetical protein
MNGMGHAALNVQVQTGAVNDTLCVPKDENNNGVIFSAETSKSVCLLKNLSTK